MRKEKEKEKEVLVQTSPEIYEKRRNDPKEG